MSGSPWDEPGPRTTPRPAVAVLLPVVISLVVQLAAATAFALWTTGPRYVLASIALAAASALALLAARRWPGPTVAVVTALTALGLLVPSVGPAPFVALGFAIVAALIGGARLWAWISVGVGWMLALIGGSLAGIEWQPVVVAVATLAIGTCFAIGEGLRSRRRLDEERRVHASQRRRAAALDEQDRMARDMHDALADSLSRISAESRVGLARFDDDPERSREALTSIRSLSAAGLDEVRGVLSFLRGEEAGAPATAPLVPLPQLAQLPSLISGRSTLGLSVTLDDALRGDLPASAVQTSAYRIVQEALANIVRHSAAATATVSLARDAGEHGDLVVTISDDGVGIPREILERAGVRGMRLRTEVLGGTLEIAPALQTGTVVRARLPWNAPA